MPDGELEKDIETEFKGKVDENSNKLLKRLADLEKEVKLLKSSGQGEEQDKEKYKMLIAQYRKFKTQSVRHFRLNSGGNSSAFGKVPFYLF